MSKEAIVDKILCDAQKKAESFIDDARVKADGILAETAEQCKAYLFSSKVETDRMCDDIESRSNTVAELDAKKLILGAKIKIIDAIFRRALEKMRTLDDERYKELLLGMLNIAEDGDVITLSAKEKELLTKEDVDKFAKSRGIKLTLAEKVGDFEGGMVFSGKGVDKNLTFDTEISIIRDEMETSIAKEVFG